MCLHKAENYNLKTFKGTQQSIQKPVSDVDNETNNFEKRFNPKHMAGCKVIEDAVLFQLRVV